MGTGGGTDVVAALETFPQLSHVAMTDLHQEVVETAKANVLSSTEKADHNVRQVALAAVAVAGDMLVPLEGQAPFDLIYEYPNLHVFLSNVLMIPTRNLPNVPLPETSHLRSGQTSSTYVGDRTADKVPRHVTSNLLDLHYVCLCQAKSLDLLSPSGAILSSMGGRVPVHEMLKMTHSAGFDSRVLGLSWKIQSEPNAVIGGYAEHQKHGLGPVSLNPER